MLKKVKLTKDWKGHKAGAILEVDEATFEEIKAADAGDEYDAKAEAAAKAKADEEAASIKSTVADAIKDALKDLKTEPKNVSVHDKSDDDPCLGYLGEHNKTMKDLTPSDVHLAFGRFAKDVATGRSGRMPERLVKCMDRTQKMVEKAAEDGLVVGDDEYGGALIFPAATMMIQQSSVEVAKIRPLASKITMGTQSVTIPMIRDENRTNGQVYNGILIYMEDELDQGTTSRLKLRKLNLKLKKMMALAGVSGEWSKWAPVSMGSWLIPKFGEAVGYKEDLMFINGKGGGEAKGLLNAGCKIEVEKENNQDPDTFTFGNSLDMLKRFKLSGASRIAWVMNQTVLAQLPRMNQAIGTGGSPVFVNTATDKMPMSLWGHPIIVTEKCPVLGDAGDVSLISGNDYLIADDQSGPAIAVSMHLKFDYDQDMMRLIKYIDGENITDVEYTPYQAGTTAPDTLSPVVTLAERA